MRLIIDRFEGDFAVCEVEKGQYTNIPISELPQDVHEGDIIVMENNKCSIDNSSTKARKESMNKLLSKLLNKNNQE